MCTEMYQTPLLELLPDTCCSQSSTDMLHEPVPSSDSSDTRILSYRQLCEYWTVETQNEDT